MEKTPKENMHFIRRIIDEDLTLGLDKVVTRFPPEPNGFLHIGHAKSICLNFGLAADYQGQCHLRFDDTNPMAEEEVYARAIEADVKWLGFSFDDHHYHASDYYTIFYALALDLIDRGLAYVDSLTPDQMREYRGTLTEPGRESPDRNRPVAESRALFEAMRKGEHKEGSLTLRAKIDMASGNINLRDPVMYRLLHAKHARTGDQWCIYPMYAFAHPISDALEGITHSLCTLEFQDQRPLYDWFVAHCAWQQYAKHTYAPKQIEFSRLNLTHTITSKRKLKQLVDEGHVDGWDDPRMPTISALRRRGIRPEALLAFCQEIGISKQDSIIDYALLEQAARSDLNEHAHRRMAVLDPIEVIIDNYPENQTETLSMPHHPQKLELGYREVPFGQKLWIDRDDFSENPPPKYQRLTLNGEVRLLGAYAILCTKVVHDEAGRVIRLHCTYDKDTLGGKKPLDGRKIKGTIHWLFQEGSVDAKVHLYDRLFQVKDPGACDNPIDALNPNALQIMQAKVEKGLEDLDTKMRYQFVRLGYFCRDSAHKDTVFNRIVTLRETWKSD